jgi:regulator of cell morphogenesis and NO signaling
MANMNHCCCASHGEQSGPLITNFFQKDHEEIDRLFMEAIRNVREASKPVQAFEEFDRRLDRHIRWEEEILFPAVEKLNPDLSRGPGQVMRMEHVEIKKLKDEFRRLENPGTGEYSKHGSKLLEHLRQILSEHNAKEENVYYPIADQMLSEDEKTGLLKRLSAGS